MNLNTLTATVAAPRDTVFNFLADIENLPRWAPGFCERLYLERGRWKALTSHGELYLELEAGTEAGVIDLRAGPATDQMALLPIRVLALNSGACVVTMTFMSGPEWPSGILQRDAVQFASELRTLVRRFGGGELHEPATAYLLELGLN